MNENLKDLFARLSAPFHPDDIEWRVGATNAEKTKALALAYITSRAVTDRLDEVIGPENWRDEYAPGPDGGVICGLSLRIHDEWITKWDGADNTDIEAIKSFLLAVMPALAGEPVPARPPVPKEIKAYDIDFKWGPGGPNAFPKPGLWGDADPAAHVAWYESVGCNVIQTFCVSCNGYAWFKNGVVPEQPGLKHDFLPEVVRLAHRKNMLVFGYFCIGANTRWGQTRPDLSYGLPSEPHIPFTDEYLAHLDGVIRDAVKRTGMDGFMVDWLHQPTSRKSNGNRWLDCEQKQCPETV